MMNLRKMRTNKLILPKLYQRKNQRKLFKRDFKRKKNLRKMQLTIGKLLISMRSLIRLRFPKSPISFTMLKMKILLLKLIRPSGIKEKQSQLEVPLKLLPKLKRMMIKQIFSTTKMKSPNKLD
jgi:hypothetical protein